MATAGADAASFDPETSGPAMMDNSSVDKPKPRVKMSINIPVDDDSELAVNRQGQLSVKKGRAVHIQVMRVREQEEHLCKGVNPEERFAFLPTDDVFFRYSKATLPSPLGVNSGVQLL